jgi:hypothetical protein
MLEIVWIRFLPSCFHLFPGVESRRLSNLVLIPFCLARDLRTLTS